MKRVSFLVSVLAAVVNGQQAAYGQCGGIGWTGATTCVSGFTCTASGDYYSQCVPGTASGGSPTTLATIVASSTIASGITGTAVAGKFKYLGVDESVAEWGTKMPGVLGTDYSFPSTSTIDVRSFH